MAARLPPRLLATATFSIQKPAPAFTCAQCSWLRALDLRSSQQRTLSSQPILRSSDMPSSTGRKFTYHSAAAFSGKYKRLDPASNVFHFNPYNHIQPQRRRPKAKRPASGQDAFFISRLGGSGNSVALGVADGVGGWEDSGVDPADFSHNFCDYMASAAYEYRPSSDVPAITPRNLMQKGYDDVCNDKSIPAGGSTACVAIANEDGRLEVANLGDSGFVHLRLNAVHNYSDPQTHAFNTPYQLSVVPASMLARAAAFGGAQLCDYPKDADVTTHDLKHGDIVIFASDGVWDNLFNQDILRIASKLMTGIGAWKASAGGIKVADSLTPFTTPEEQGEQSTAPSNQVRNLTLQSALALEILGAAKSASTNQRLDGPFAKEVQRYYPGENWHGGKIDDICIIVMVVSEEGGAEIKAKL